MTVTPGMLPTSLRTRVALSAHTPTPVVGAIGGRRFWTIQMRQVTPGGVPIPATLQILAENIARYYRDKDSLFGSDRVAVRYVWTCALDSLTPTSDIVDSGASTLRALSRYDLSYARRAVAAIAVAGPPTTYEKAGYPTWIPCRGVFNDLVAPSLLGLTTSTRTLAPLLYGVPISPARVAYWYPWTNKSPLGYDLASVGLLFSPGSGSRRVKLTPQFSSPATGRPIIPIGLVSTLPADWPLAADSYY